MSERYYLVKTLITGYHNVVVVGGKEAYCKRPNGYVLKDLETRKLIVVIPREAQELIHKFGAVNAEVIQRSEIHYVLKNKEGYDHIQSPSMVYDTEDYLCLYDEFELSNKFIDNLYR